MTVMAAPGLGSRAATALDELWSAHRATPSIETRNRLILHYAPLVKVVAGRFHASAPAHVEHADLASWGIFGLIDAIDRFDPDRAVKFETFATRRIHGAIADGLRAHDWVPRRVRRQARAIAEARSRLEQHLGREPQPAEIAAELRTDPARLDSWRADADRAVLHTLEPRPGADSIGSEPADDDPSGMPGFAIDEAATGDWVVDALQTLSHRERLVLTLSYFESQTLEAIGAVLDVTESRVSQIRTKALNRLRQRLADPRLAGPG